MASITIKNIPEDLYAQLKQAAETNLRSLPQEVLARLKWTFEGDAALNKRRDQSWIDEALASGPSTLLRTREMKAIRDKVLTKRS